MADHVVTEQHDGVAVARVSGDIDLINHESVMQQLLQTAIGSGPRFVLDLSGVTYVDSNGIRMLFALASELEDSRIDWAVALGAASPLTSLFKVTAFDEVARIFTSVPDAVTAASAQE